ncbi:hypothetical protein PITCH_A1340003 [uncultured Desulfobacterium sp.]|uniref:Uncharacterized protein n=1 Tax=uncultured Desulfobacterium sp. TaxID=201089 RepID=A0A445MSH4_9BACT|nr:hypothetical protein PITCH_A1340003 [uncultured Desulfobacterium sp.]
MAGEINIMSWRLNMKAGVTKPPSTYARGWFSSKITESRAFIFPERNHKICSLMSILL